MASKPNFDQISPGGLREYKHRSQIYSNTWNDNEIACAFFSYWEFPSQMERNSVENWDICYVYTNSTDLNQYSQFARISTELAYTIGIQIAKQHPTKTFDGNSKSEKSHVNSFEILLLFKFKIQFSFNMRQWKLAV